MQAHILIVEDDKRLAELLSQELSLEGHESVAVHSGAEALLQAEEKDFDLIILDLNLPDMDGIEVAERVRRRSQSSILMLSARGDVGSRVEGLYAGAADYMTKPFSLQELMARVHVRLREQAAPVSTLSYKNLQLDLNAKSCYVGEAYVALTAHEFTLLELLLKHQGRIYAKDELERKLYGGDLPGSNTVEVFVSNLRKKLAEAGLSQLISTVRGMGYMIQ